MLTEMAGQVASIGSSEPRDDRREPLLCGPEPRRRTRPHGVRRLVHVSGPVHERQVPVEDWFLGPRATRLGHAEVVTAITLRLPATSHGAAFLKLGRYAGEDLAQANLAVLITDDLDYRVAFGAVAPETGSSASYRSAVERLGARRGGDRSGGGDGGGGDCSDHRHPGHGGLPDPHVPSDAPARVARRGRPAFGDGAALPNPPDLRNHAA